MCVNYCGHSRNECDLGVSLVNHGRQVSQSIFPLKASAGSFCTYFTEGESPKSGPSHKDRVALLALTELAERRERWDVALPLPPRSHVVIMKCRKRSRQNDVEGQQGESLILSPPFALY